MCRAGQGRARRPQPEHREGPGEHPAQRTLDATGAVDAWRGGGRGRAAGRPCTPAPRRARGVGRRPTDSHRRRRLHDTCWRRGGSSSPALASAKAMLVVAIQSHLLDTSARFPQKGGRRRPSRRTLRGRSPEGDTFSISLPGRFCTGSPGGRATLVPFAGQFAFSEASPPRWHGVRCLGAGEAREWAGLANCGRGGLPPAI